MSFTSRNGFYSLRKHARLLCKFVNAFTPIITKQFSDNSSLLAALAAANAACAILVEEIDEVAEPGV
jgi:hypothetical protein